LAPEDARYYINSTCVEVTPIACSNVQVSQPVLYPVKALELVLNKGRQILPDDQYLPREVGEETLAGWARPLDEGGLAVELAALDSFEAFMAAYWRALAEVMGAAVAGALAEAERLARYGASPLVSPLINDCLARGRDAAQGGARDNDWDTMVVGFSTAVDSLNGIRQAVYGEGVVSLSDLRDTLRDDFAQREPLRQYLRNRCNKYGNDDPKADAMAVELYDAIRRELARYETCLGGRFHIGVFAGWGGQPHGAHINRGLVTAATPDGRHAGEPLSECIAPAAGAARSGLTAMMRSVTRMDHRYGLGGISVNVRLDPSVLRHAADREKLVALLRAFMRQGAFEVQMTAVDDETLREAQRHPEAYRTLTVRVAGYSDYFWHLDERLQEEIIQRTAHELR
jgi:formate C-acetyltransferase